MGNYLIQLKVLDHSQEDNLLNVETKALRSVNFFSYTP